MAFRIPPTLQPQTTTYLFLYSSTLTPSILCTPQRNYTGVDLKETTQVLDFKVFCSCCSFCVECYHPRTWLAHSPSSAVCSNITLSMRTSPTTLLKVAQLLVPHKSTSVLLPNNFHHSTCCQWTYCVYILISLGSFSQS